jgi:hypothetical protein
MKTRIVLGVVLLAALLLISHVIVKARTFAQRRGELLEQSPNEVTLTLRAVAERQPVRRGKEWSGSVEDEKLAKDAPACITSAKALEKLWKDWKLTDKMPDIDFQKELVVVSTATGSKLRLALTLDDKGDLQVGGIATRDFRPGFRYVLATVSNEGVKMVNGKGLPKE